MRIRSIRPEFWTSEDVARLPIPDRLVFIGLWSYVDDNGVGRDVEPLIVAALFPFDDLSESSLNVHGALKRLFEGGQIERYEVGGKRYLYVKAWDRHQKINRATPARYPLPTCDDAAEQPLWSGDDGALTESSLTGEGEKGRRGEGEKGGNPPPRKRAGTGNKGTRVPDPFTPSQESRDKILTECRGLDLRAEHEVFMDYWRAKPGAQGVKLDWDATWRNWMRRSYERADNRGALNGRPGPMAATAATLDLGARLQAAQDAPQARQIGGAR